MTARPGSHLGDRQVALIQAQVEALDRVAREMESKWGVGRLPLLVDPTLAARFYQQREKVNKAVWDDQRPEEVEAACAAMIRAWCYLDQTAAAQGERPLEPAYWETMTRDGTVVVIARDNPSGWAVQQQNRAAMVFTLDEIGHLLASQSLIAKVKQTFPGAKVTGVRVKAKDADLNDPIPW